MIKQVSIGLVGLHGAAGREATPGVVGFFSTLPLNPHLLFVMTTRKPLLFAQALVDTGKHDEDCEVYTIPYNELKYEDLQGIDTPNPLGLSAGYWGDSTKLALLAIISAKIGIVVQFPEPPRRPQAVTQAIDLESEGYQALQTLLARPVGEFFSFDMAPLSMTLYLEQGLRLANAIDIQCAFSAADRYSIAAILKAALGDETKIWEGNLAAAFDNITFNPDVRTAVLEPVKRAWLACHLGTVDDAIMTYNEVPRINTVDMDEAVSTPTLDGGRI